MYIYIYIQFQFIFERKKRERQQIQERVTLFDKRNGVQKDSVKKEKKDAMSHTYVVTCCFLLLAKLYLRITNIYAEC